jgi:uncharacterized protein (DUF697 family)
MTRIMGLGSSLKIANLWRVVREIDLQVIREQARMPFDLTIASDRPELAARLRASLSPHGTGSPHPWIHLVAPDETPTVTTPDAAIVVSSSLPLPARLDALVRDLQRSRVPTVVAHVASVGDPAQTPDARGSLVVADLDADGAAAIAAALVELLPDERPLAFAHQLPPFRRLVFEQIIEQTARANATYSLTTGLAESVPVLTVPLNLGDMVILTKNQLLMSYRLVLAAGRDGEPRTLLTEILGVLGGGLIFRQLARQLVGLIPVAGLIPKVAIAYGGTWAIGRAVVLWATEGRAVTVETVRALSTEGLERGRRLARELVARARPASSPSRAGRWARFKAALPGVSKRKPPDPPSSSSPPSSPSSSSSKSEP